MDTILTLNKPQIPGEPVSTHLDLLRRGCVGVWKAASRVRPRGIDAAQIHREVSTKGGRDGFDVCARPQPALLCVHP